MATTDAALQGLSKQNGFIGAAIGHGESGMVLDAICNSDKFDMDVAIASNCEVVRAKIKAMNALKLDTHIDDILITLGSQYHLIRPYHDNPMIFFYLALDRDGANLAMARMALEKADKSVEI